MKLSRIMLAALFALPLAGAALAADEAAGQTGIDRMPPGAEAPPAMPADAAPAPDAAPEKAAAGGGTDPDKAAAKADGDAADRAGATADGDPEAGKDADKSGAASSAEKDGHEAGSGRDRAVGEKESAPAEDDDPALDRARAQPVEAPAPPAPRDEEPASSRI